MRDEPDRVANQVDEDIVGRKCRSGGLTPFLSETWVREQAPDSLTWEQSVECHGAPGVQPAGDDRVCGVGAEWGDDDQAAGCWSRAVVERDAREFEARQGAARLGLNFG